MDDRRYPDAVMFPDAWKGSGDPLKQAHTLLDHAEKMLGVDRAAGQRAHVRHSVGGGMRFCTKDPHDTVLYPTKHPLEGQPRYRWLPQADGSEHGYLIEKHEEDDTLA